MKSYKTAGCALAAISAAAGCSAPQQKPNVLLILADDYGWNDTGFMGSDIYETPNLDRLADISVQFSDAYASCQVSSPSRASILTGLYTTRHRVTSWIGDPYGTDWRSRGRHTRLLPAEYPQQLDPEFVTMAEALKAQGYKTFLAGKWHLGGDVTPEMQGFDINIGGWEAGNPKGGYFSPYKNPALPDGPAGENLSERLGRETAAFIEEEASKNEPFFAFLSFYAVHAPIQTTEELWNKYREKIEAHGYDATEEGFEVDRLMAVRKYQDCPVYAGLVEMMDRGAGIVLDKVRELGLEDNTIIIFTSDNGGVVSGDNFATSLAPLRGGKGRQWEGGIRVPLTIHLPGMKTKTQCSTPVNGIDLYPTVMDLIGAPVTEGVDGVSLKPLLTGGVINERPLFWHYPHYGNQGGEPSSIIRSGDWKLIWYHEDGHSELYYLPDDIGEKNQLQDKYPQLADSLKNTLMDWLASTDAKMPTPDPEYTFEAEKAYKAKAIPEQKDRYEKTRRQMMDPNWSPDPTWWGSQPSVED